jgi:hypothetical protein
VREKEVGWGGVVPCPRQTRACLGLQEGVHVLPRGCGRERERERGCTTQGACLLCVSSRVRLGVCSWGGGVPRVPFRWPRRSC